MKQDMKKPSVARQKAVGKRRSAVRPFKKRMLRAEKRVYWIESFMRDNWLALFEEIKANGELGPAHLYAWYRGETQMLEQSILELKYLDYETKEPKF